MRGTQQRQDGRTDVAKGSTLFDFSVPSISASAAATAP